MSISIYFGLAVSAVLSIFFLALVKGGSRKSAWEQQRQDDEQMEVLAEQEAIRAIERDLFDGTGTEARYF